MPSGAQQPANSLSDAIARAFGRALAGRRELLGLSQSEVAERIGLSYQQVQKYESGRSSVSLPRMLELAYALETTPHALLEEAATAAAEPLAEYRENNRPTRDRITERRLREERRVLRIIRELKEAGHRRAVLALAESLLEAERGRKR
jgi:transcriptional regulator with XRE-family HTH domain